MFDDLVSPRILSQFAQLSSLAGFRAPVLTAFNSPGMKSAMATIMNSAALGFEGEYELVPGTPGRPAKYAPDRPREKFLAHLRRLGWIEPDNRCRYGVTLLGHALLKAEGSTDATEEDATVMVLSAEDDLAYGHVLGVIAECGEALIVDGYLDAQELLHILVDSNATRFLVGNKLSKARLAELAIRIRLSSPNDHGAIRELRRTNLHDRYLIGDHKVYGLGSSLNGVGKSMTTLVEMPDVAARSIRDQAEEWWRDGEVVAWSRQFDENTVETVTAAASAPDENDGARSERVHAEAGVFRHNGCAVRHQSQETAQRCSNGSAASSLHDGN